MGARDFYLEVVLPALAEWLDEAFPEFGWRRDARGWVATNEDYTHTRLGVRAERVVAHGAAPRGFLVHGGEPTLWTAFSAVESCPARDQIESALSRAGFSESKIAASGLLADSRWSGRLVGACAGYCLHALSAASSLPSKAAIRRLVGVTLTGLRPRA